MLHACGSKDPGERCTVRQWMWRESISWHPMRIALGPPRLIRPALNFPPHAML